jgi:predicted ATPase
MLRRIYIDNFRCLVNFEIKLEPLSLLLGDNGAGKSTVFDVLRRLQDFISGRTKTDEAFLPENLTRWQSRQEQTFELELDGDGVIYLYRLKVDVNPKLKKSRVLEESLSVESGSLYEFIDGQAHLYHDDSKPGPSFPFDWSVSGLSFILPRDDNQKLTAFKKLIEKLIILHLFPSQIPAASSGEADRLTSLGANFASWWRVLSQERPDLVSASNDVLKKVFDNLIGARLVNSGANTRILTLVFGPPEPDENSPLEFSRIVRENIEFSFDELSDGQRALFILYTLVIGLRDQGYLLFLDEPENYVSLPEIQPWLMELSDACGDGIDQACIISHHPEQINYLGAEHGIWLDRDSGGPTRRISPQFDGESGLSLAEAVARGWVK